MDNRQGLVVDVKITEATGTSERDAALDMLQMVPSSGRITVGADRGYDTRDFVWDCRDMHITPHVAQRRHSAIDGRTTRHGGYRLSQRVRKRVEEVFGWVKTVGGGRKLRYRGVDRTVGGVDGRIQPRPPSQTGTEPGLNRAVSVGTVLVRDGSTTPHDRLTQTNDLHLQLPEPHPGLAHHRKQPSSTPC